MLSTFLVTLVGLVAVCQAEWRVINGSDAIMHEFPSIVSLKFGKQHFCGGTLINNNTVLTAAHCVFNIRYESEQQFQRRGFVAVLGEHQLDKQTGKERIIPVQKVRIPSAYNNAQSFVYGNDIALVRLARDVVLEDHVRIAKYPAEGQEPSVPGQTCTVVGWGSLFKHGFGASNVLQKANLNIISNDACSMRFYFARNNPSNVCAGSGSSSTSACRGDSGGPIFCKQRDGSLIQVGAVSYGKVPCGQPNIPTVFTRVSHFANWIKQNL